MVSETRTSSLTSNANDRIFEASHQNPSIPRCSVSRHNQPEKGHVSLPMRILKHSDKRVKNCKTRDSHVKHLGGLSRLFTRIVSPEGPDKKMFLLRKRNDKIFVNVGLIPSLMRNLLDILDTEAGSTFLREDQLTSFLETQVVHESETTKIYDANDKPLCIVGSTKLYVLVVRMKKLVNFLVCEPVTVPAILGCVVCDQFVNSVHSKAGLVRPIDASTLLIVRHYGNH